MQAIVPMKIQQNISVPYSYPKIAFPLLSYAIAHFREIVLTNLSKMPHVPSVQMQRKKLYINCE
jgi:hypothetical protein